MSQFFVRAKGKWKEFITSFTGHFRLRYSNLQSFKKGNYPQYHSSYHLPIGSEGAPRVKQANVSLVFQETINNLFLRRMQAYAPRTSIMEFHNEDDLAGWRIITDESMGGLSHGSLRLESGIHPSTGKPIKVMIFEGEIYALKKLAAPEALPLMVRK